jgi:hypothetical protein
VAPVDLEPVDVELVDAERWCEPVVVAPVPAAWPLPEWVDRPMPNEAPRAPTIPRPARPAWSLLLRWRGVMPTTVRTVPVPNL